MWTATLITVARVLINWRFLLSSYSIKNKLHFKENFLIKVTAWFSTLFRKLFTPSKQIRIRAELFCQLGMYLINLRHIFIILYCAIHIRCLAQVSVEILPIFTKYSYLIKPVDLPKMALPPCHVMCQFYVAKGAKFICIYTCSKLDSI